ncbi:MAG: SGNH/GDSL hydrolase family protein [Holophagae bacterium]|jgi:lysophospholipase L1-like esterase
MKKLILSTTMAALLVSASAMAQVDFSRYVALGDSLTAGYVGGGLMDYYQNRSFPARLAAQADVGTFEMPLISPPGLAPVLVLQSLSPLVIDTTDVAPPADPFEYFYNVTLEAPYQNLAIPGSNTYDTLFTTGNILNLIAGNQNNVMPDLILRTPQVQDPTTGEMIDYTPLVAAISQQPTFVTLWIGNNDYLSALITATPLDGVTMTPIPAFEQYMTGVIGGLATSLPNAQIVVMSLFGDARWVAFADSVANSVDVPGVGTVTLVGEDGELTSGDRLTLAAADLIAQGYGLPIPGAPPLPENLDITTGAPGVILRETELDAIVDRAAAYNQIIDGLAGQFSNVHVFDVNPWFSRLANGTYRSFGGIELNTDLLVGGFFSYDGIHPQNMGQSVIAYELINFLNSELGAGLDQIDMREALNEGDWRTGGSGVVCVTCDPKNARLTRTAFAQLYELFAPDLARRWQQHRAEHQMAAAVD